MCTKNKQPNKYTHTHRYTHRHTHTHAHTHTRTHTQRHTHTETHTHTDVHGLRHGSSCHRLPGRSSAGISRSPTRGTLSLWNFGFIGFRVSGGSRWGFVSTSSGSILRVAGPGICQVFGVELNKILKVRLQDSRV